MNLRVKELIYYRDHVWDPLLGDETIEDIEELIRESEKEPFQNFRSNERTNDRRFIMKIVATKNTVMVIVGQTRIPLVTLASPAAAMKAVKWTRKHESAVEGATALLDYCKGHGLKPKGRKIAKKYCPALSGLRADYR